VLYVGKGYEGNLGEPTGRLIISSIRQNPKWWYIQR